jgi:methylenetetrahydrofolate reductase (NADPH)
VQYQTRKDFRTKLKEGERVLTLELSPPKGTDISRVLERAKTLRGRVDAINVPDCQLAMLKMSSLATCRLIQDATGLETVWQMTCRDRNSIALQSEVLGGYALGLRHILALTGDPVQVGDQKDHAKQVFHLESVRFLDMLQGLNAGRDVTGKELPRQGTDLTVGAALNPFRIGQRAQQMRLQQKMERQVSFFQTQPIYDLDAAERLQEAIAQSAEIVGCRRPKILLGLIPPKNADAARKMNQMISGVVIPPDLIELLERSSQPELDSIRYCADMAARMLPFADGLHLMPVGAMAKHALALVEAMEDCLGVSSPA